MAITSQFKRSSASIKFDSGETTSTGATKIVSVNLGSLDPSAMGDQEGKQKAYNITSALTPLIALDFYELQGTTVVVIDEE